MFSYPVHRQIWPEIACRIVASSGSGLWSSRCRAVIIIPGVQNPHCRPCSLMNPSCTGSSLPPTASPSTVRTRCPSAIAASTVQVLTGSSSSQATHVPHCEVSHPQWVPVSRNVSRRWCTSRVRPSTSSVCSTPLTVMCTCMSVPFLGTPAGAGCGAAERPSGQFVGEVLLVDDRAALIGARAAALGGEPSGLGDGVGGQGLPAQVFLGVGGAAVIGADRGESDPHVGDGVALEDHERAGRRDGPVAGA